MKKIITICGLTFSLVFGGTAMSFAANSNDDINKQEHLSLSEMSNGSFNEKNTYVLSTSMFPGNERRMIFHSHKGNNPIPINYNYEEIKTSFDF